MSADNNLIDYIAIDERDRVAAQTIFAGNILVSAAAGSGKTSSLTKRVINCLRQKNADGSYVGIEQIMMVTFTDAATIEMRSRIATELDVMAQECQDAVLKRHFRRQQALLGNAYISTIHSLCARLVRENFHLLAIDPKMKLLDAAAAKMLQQDCIEELFEQHYQNKAANFLQLVEWFCSDKNDEQLHEAIIDLYNFAANRLDDRGWLNNLAELFWPQSARCLLDCAWGKKLFEIVITDLQQAVALYNQAYVAGENNGQLSEVTGVAAGELAQAELVLAQAEACDYDALFETLPQAGFSGWSAKGLSKKSLNVKANMADFDFIKTNIDNARKLVKKQQERFALPLTALVDRNEKTRQMVSALAELVLAFSEKYAVLKRERAKMDFSDLERFCVTLLQKPEAELLLDGIQQRFVEIMTDEYQDTNEVQEQILELLAGGKIRRFMVGDVKQSVYGFRQADPTIFTGKLKAYEKNIGGKALKLTRNFRSRSAVLESANFVFERIMSDSCGGIDYDELAALRYGAAKIYDDEDNKRITIDPVTELIIINKDSKKAAVNEFAEGAAAEAQLIAGKIKELMKDSPVVFDKENNQWRTLSYRDCAIILRKKSSAPEIQNVLRNNSIPSYSDIGDGYFLAYEVRLMLSLLAVIDNPLQDIPLAGVLRSPIFEFTDVELAQIRLLQPAGCFWQALKMCESEDVYLNEKIINTVTRIQQWRDLNKQLQIHELLQDIYDNSRFFDYVAALPSGNIRQANLRMLSEHAVIFERADFKGLFRFLKYIELLKKRQQELEEGKALSANDDVVRIITAHGSKGLEYPVVFVPEIGKKFGAGPDLQLFNLHKNFGIGPKFVDIAENVVYDSLPALVNREAKRLDELAEEMRILYVAMTRAREKLIMIGSLPGNTGWSKRSEEWANHAGQIKLPINWVTEQSSWLDWIGAALSTDCELAKILLNAEVESEPVNGWKITIKPIEQIPVVELEVERGYFADTLNNSVTTDEIRKTVNTILDWNYEKKYRKVEVSPKLTVTELKRQALAGEEEPEAGALLPDERADILDISLRKPDFKRLLGIAYHEIFQRISFQATSHIENVDRIIVELVQQTIITAAVADEVDRNKIAAFLLSPLANRVRESKTVRREQAFVLLQDAKELGEKIGKDYPADEKVLLQGIIDLLFAERDGSFVIVDYKTDNVSDKNILRERYETQLGCYAAAVERITGRTVSEKIIWHVPSATMLVC
ncbi:MAG: helicase-exonuclease AddAB subunit AddA [Negativicutes bacterium]|jgi:ATP-dependent helicase/nuclease subunit A